MNKIVKVGMFVVVFIIILMGGGVVKVSVVIWLIMDKYGLWSNSGYIFNNDVWGEGLGV